MPVLDGHREGGGWGGIAIERREEEKDDRCREREQDQGWKEIREGEARKRKRGGWIGCLILKIHYGPNGYIFLMFLLQMFQTLYGQTAAALYAKAAGQNAQARQLYNASADTYYKANDAAAYDDWVRARNHWDYFYNRS